MIERIILGSLITQPSLFRSATKIVNEEDFYENRTMFSLLYEMYTNSEAIDLATVSIKAGQNGINPAEVIDLTKNIGSTDNFQTHLLKLKEISIRLKLVSIATDFRQNIDNTPDVFEVISDVKRKLEEVEPNFKSGVNNMTELLAEVNARIEENSRGIKGVFTGINDFDTFSKGLQRGDLVVIAGETSQGKTSLALSWAFNQILDGKNIAIYSYEMSTVQIAARIVSIASSVSSKSILMDKLSDGEYNDVNQAFTELMEKHLFVIETIESSYQWLESSIVSMVDTYGIDAVYVDYLQLITIKGASKKDAAAHSANGLKRLAKSSKVDIPIIALSQLARDKQSPSPSLDRLKESGDIENAADTVIGIYRPDHYGFTELSAYNTNGDIQSKDLGIMKVLKGRNIGLINLAVKWQKEITYYSNYIEDGIF